MKSKYVRMWTLALALIVIGAGVALAAVTFDSNTCTGFVGKGDVQLKCGWNNAQLQANAGNVAFSYQTTDTYEAVCTWITGEGTKGEKTHNVTHTTSTDLASTIVYDTRKNSQGQITGFNITACTDTVTTGTIPVVGEACPGNEGTDGTWSLVTLTGTTSSLYVDCDKNTSPPDPQPIP